MWIIVHNPIALSPIIVDNLLIVFTTPQELAKYTAIFHNYVNKNTIVLHCQTIFYQKVKIGVFAYLIAK